MKRTFRVYAAIFALAFAIHMIFRVDYGDAPATFFGMLFTSALVAFGAGTLWFRLQKPN